MDAGEAYRQVWCFAVARQLLLLFESDVEVAEAALAECDDDASSEVKREALVEALLSNARAAIERLGGGGDLTSRVLVRASSSATRAVYYLSPSFWNARRWRAVS